MCYLASAKLRIALSNVSQKSPQYINVLSRRFFFVFLALLVYLVLLASSKLRITASIFEKILSMY